MVDNKDNQWEDTEYIEDDEVLDEDVLEEDNEVEEYEEDTESYDDDGASDEEDGEEYEEYEDGDEEYEEYDEEEGEESPQKKKMLVPLIIILALLLAGTGFGISKFMSNKNSDNISNNSKLAQPAEQVNTENSTEGQSTEEMAGDFFEQAGGEETENMMSVNFNENGEETNVMPEENQNEGENQGGEQQIATVTEPQPGEGVTESDLFAQNNNDQENDSIMVTYNKAANLNPFKPPVITQTRAIPYETINNTQFEIIEPPTAAVPDENLTKLLQTQISGIMYDSESPSAIVNLNGQDQFVKIGDVISGYKINNITKDKVQITYKNNSYVASVGELFTRGLLESQPAVANLEDKFAGRYKKNNN